MQLDQKDFKSSFANAFLEMSVSAYVVSTDHVMLYCNDYQAKILGLNSPEELIGKNPFEINPVREEAQKLIENNTVVIETRKEHFFEEHVTSLDGEYKIYSSQKKPFYIDGKLVGVIGFSTDITAQRAYEKQLKTTKETAETILGDKSNYLSSINRKVTGETSITNTGPEDYLLRVKNHFEKLLNSLPVHVYWMNREGVYMGCNDLQAKKNGMKSREEVVGKTNTDIHLHYNGTKPEILDAVNEEVMSTGITKTLEEVGTPEDGPLGAYISTKTPLFDDNGKVIGMLGASIDITSQKEAEELRVAKERSEAADQIKTDYLANVFHDVRTPINWINGAIDVLKNGGLEHWEVERKYDLMEQASNMIIRMLDDISDVARVENNELLIKPTKVDLASLIRTLEEQIMYYKPEDTVIQMDTFFYVDDPFFVQVDGVRLFQVLMNLFTNACKSIPENKRGYVVFECDLKDGRLYFSVKDSGRGIPPSKLNTIFDRFVKVNQNVTGKGIGLSISQRIVQLMGDDIKVESKVGQGSKFSFSIPFINKNDRKREEKPQKIEIPSWKDKTILIVEDIKENFELLETILRPTECAILHAKNGKKAIELFGQHKNIDIVLLDLGLPDMSGEEVLKALREQRADIPVVVQTAYAVAAKKDKLIKAGANDFITKPIRSNVLIEAIEKTFTAVSS